MLTAQCSYFFVDFQIECYKLHDPLDIENYMVVEWIKFQYMKKLMCNTCFMHRFFAQNSKLDIYRPHLPLSHLHDPHGHQEVHDGGVDQVPTYEIIYVRYMFYT